MVESSTQKAAKIQKRRIEELQQLFDQRVESDPDKSASKATTLEGQSTQKRGLESELRGEKSGKKVKITPKKGLRQVEAEKMIQGAANTQRKEGVRKKDKALTIFSRRERQVKPPEVYENEMTFRGLKHSPSPQSESTPVKEEDASLRDKQDEEGIINKESSPEGAERQAILKPALLLVSEDEEPAPMDVIQWTQGLRNEDRPDKAFLSERAKRGGLSNASSGRIFVTIPKDFFGPITAEYDPERKTGVKVGEEWDNRFACRQWGAHFPHIAGIAGKGEVGAQSVALSGGYEDDQDEGWFFIYTGSGGRDLSGNKRTNKEQSKQQVFEKQNLALKLSCQEGYPVRVVRSHKEKRSQYAPKNGKVRYDGVYRIEKCWRKPGKQNALMCRFLFVRCDNEPAPWYKEGERDHPDRSMPSIDELEGAQDVFERTKPPAWDWKESEGCWGWTRDPPVSKEAGAKTPKGASKQPPAKKKKLGVAFPNKSLRHLKAPPVNVLALTAPPKISPADVTSLAVADVTSPVAADVINEASPARADVTWETSPAVADVIRESSQAVDIRGASPAVADVRGRGDDVTAKENWARECKREYADIDSEAPIEPRAQKAVLKETELTPAVMLGISQEEIDRIRQYLGTSNPEDDVPLLRSTVHPRVLNYDLAENTRPPSVKQPGSASLQRKLTPPTVEDPTGESDDRDKDAHGNGSSSTFADRPVQKGPPEMKAAGWMEEALAESVPGLNKALQQDNQLAVCSVGHQSARFFALNLALLTEGLSVLERRKRQGLEDDGFEQGLRELRKGGALKRAADLLLHFNDELGKTGKENNDLRKQLEESERHHREAENRLARNCADKACQAGSELNQAGLGLNQLTNLRAELEEVKEGYMTLKSMAERECLTRKKAQDMNKELESDLDEVRDRVLRLAEHCERLKAERK